MRTVAGIFEFNLSLLFSIITFAVLFFILYRFFFKKVHDFMVQRENEVRSDIESAAESRRHAEETLDHYNQRIADVESEGREIIRQARDNAKDQAQGIIDRANDKARELIEHSQEQIRRERFDARKRLREEVGDLAVLAAGRIMEKEISADDHEDIINRVIEEADERPWS